MSKYNSKLLKTLLSALAGLSSLSASVPVSALRPVPQALPSQGQNVIQMAGAQWTSGNVAPPAPDKIKSGAFDPTWAPLVITSDGILFNPTDGNLVVIPRENLATGDNNKPTTKASVAAVAAYNTGSDQSKFAPWAGPDTRQAVFNLIKLGAQNAPKYDDKILSKKSLGKSIFIDRNGFIRNQSRQFLKAGSWGGAPQWTSEINERQAALTTSTLDTLRAAGILKPEGLMELALKDSTYIDSDGYLRLRDNSFADESGKATTKDEEKVQIPSGVGAVNGVTQADFLSQSAFSLKSKSLTRDIVSNKSNQGNIVVVRKRKVLRGDGDAAKWEKIECLETIDGSKTYCCDGQWRKPADAAKSKDPSQQVMTASDGAAKFKIPLEDIRKGSWALWDTASTLKRTGMIAGSAAGTLGVATAAAGGIYYATRKEPKTAQPPKIHNTPAQTPAF